MEVLLLELRALLARALDRDLELAALDAAGFEVLEARLFGAARRARGARDVREVLPKSSETVTPSPSFPKSSVLGSSGVSGAKPGSSSETSTSVPGTFTRVSSTVRDAGTVDIDETETRSAATRSMAPRIRRSGCSPSGVPGSSSRSGGRD
jgi:hypothetical protein